MSNIYKLYNAIEDKKVILGVGPMSKNCIDSAIELANEKKIPMILVASRRQIESCKLGIGYVWSTEEFSEYVREKDVGNYIFLERDHGGPFQGNCLDDFGRKFSEEQELDISLMSFEADIELGFDIIHIDLSKYYHLEYDLEFFVNKCISYANRYGKKIIFEVGDEEGSGDIKNIKKFQKMVERIQDLDITFIVANTGLNVRELENYGTLKIDYVKKMLKICKKQNLYFKVHNADYLNDYEIDKLYKLGVHSINIAPELGTIESSTYMNCLLSKNLNDEYDKFCNNAYESGKWKKWMIKDTDYKYDKEGLAKICGHYVFKNYEIDEMRKKYNFDKECKDAIKDRLKQYLSNLGWEKELHENMSSK